VGFDVICLVICFSDFPGTIQVLKSPRNVNPPEVVLGSGGSGGVTPGLGSRLEVATPSTIFQG
jgi:hypothetical protein